MNSQDGHRILADFKAAHPKGADVVDRLYRHPSELIVSLLITGSTRWRGYKALVKHLDVTMELYEDGYKHSRDWGSKYYTFDKYLRRVLKRRLFPSELDLLDMLNERDQSLGAGNQ